MAKKKATAERPNTLRTPRINSPSAILLRFYHEVFFEPPNGRPAITEAVTGAEQDDREKFTAAQLIKDEERAFGLILKAGLGTVDGRIFPQEGVRIHESMPFAAMAKDERFGYARYRPEFRLPGHDNGCETRDIRCGRVILRIIKAGRIGEMSIDKTKITGALVHKRDECTDAFRKFACGKFRTRGESPVLSRC